MHFLVSPVTLLDGDGEWRCMDSEPWLFYVGLCHIVNDDSSFALKLACHKLLMIVLYYSNAPKNIEVEEILNNDKPPVGGNSQNSS